MRNNKKGSTSVFLMMILIAMIGLAGAFVYGAKQMTDKSYGDGVVRLAGKSILSEFDLDLKREYGILAFYGWDRETVRKVSGYLEPALQWENSLEIRDVSVNFCDYTLQNRGILKKQIIDYMKTIPGEKKKESEEKIGDRESSLGDNRDRVLKNQEIINGLPSTALGKNPVSFADRIRELKNRILSMETILKEGTETYLIQEYILLQFKNRLEQGKERDTFFTNEVEYILEGDFDNRKNGKAIENDLMVFRSILNGEYLYRDPARREETMAFAQALTPGAAALLTQAAIITTWSLAEAENDVDLLLQGKKVPFMKNTDSWATDLESVIQNMGKECIDPGTTNGLQYRDYLMYLLFLQEESEKLARVMDLIQINMKGTYNGEFNFCDYHSGMRLGAQVNDSEYQYEIQY